MHKRIYITVWASSPTFSNSPFAIRVNLLHPSPSLLRYGLLLSLWCFSILLNCYFQVSLNKELFSSWLKITQNTLSKLSLSNGTVIYYHDGDSLSCFVTARIKKLFCHGHRPAWWLLLVFEFSRQRNNQLERVDPHHHHRVSRVLMWDYRDLGWHDISVTYSYLSALQKMKLWIRDPRWDLNWCSPPQSYLGPRSQGTSGNRISLPQSVWRCDSCLGQCFVWYLSGGSSSDTFLNQQSKNALY